MYGDVIVAFKDPKYSQAEGRHELFNPQPDTTSLTTAKLTCGLSTNNLQRPAR